MAKEGVLVGRREVARFEVITEFLKGGISRTDAATVLRLSERSISRLARRLEGGSLAALIHRNRGRTPKHKINDISRAQAVRLTKDLYFDFNLTHAHEMLVAEHGLKASYATFRRWCADARLPLKRRKRRRNKRRTPRERMPAEGLLMQFDGSTHHWNRVEKWCLIGGIDDATSEVPHAEFYYSESTLACMKVLMRVIEKKGIPRVLYVDRAGIYGGMKRQNFAQFERACHELGIDIIYADSPQGKGRIERMWSTFQDRLVAELRLKGITAMSEANEYLSRQFLPNYWNQKLVVRSQNPESFYRAAPPLAELREIFCLKEARNVKNDSTISWEGVTYVVAAGPEVIGRQIEIRTYADGKTQATFMGQRVELRSVRRNRQRNRAA